MEKFYILLFYLILKIINCGKIKKTTLTPIQLSIANEFENADYTFTFILQTTIPQNGIIKVTFPPEYNSQLGIPIILGDTCNLQCQISDLTVIFTLNSQFLSNQQQTLTIKRVKNPSKRGGTGNFIIESYDGYDILDSNKMFGTIGIAPSPKNLTSTYITYKTGESSIIGSISQLTLNFKPSNTILSPYYLILTIPNQIIIPSQQVVCSQIAINSLLIGGNIKCEKITNKNEIQITGLTEDIHNEREVSFQFTIQLPSYSCTTSTFQIGIFRTNTNMLYEWRTGIEGIIVNPATLQSVLIGVLPIGASYQISKEKILDFELKFNLVNQLNGPNSVIQIEFPSDFPLVYETTYDYCKVQGLTNYDEWNRVKLSCNKNFITIQNFQNIASGSQIIATFRAISPSISGESQPLKIQTFTNDSLLYIIDQDVKTAKITVNNVNSGAKVLLDGITSSNTQANGLSTNFNTSFQPTQSIPIGGIITLTLPSSFTFIGAFLPADCLINGIASSSCSNTGQIVSIVSAVVVQAAQISYFEINNKINTPIFNGTFLLNIELFDNLISIQDSFTEFVIIQAKLMPPSSFLCKSSGAGMKSIVEITFTTDQSVPDGGKQVSQATPQGQIHIKFEGGWDYDIGSNLGHNETIPCFPQQGIIAISGEQYLCILHLGNNKSPPEIIVKNFQSIGTAVLCKIHFPKLRNPTPVFPFAPPLAYQITVSTISFEDNIEKHLNTQTSSFTITANVAVTNSLDFLVSSFNVASSFNIEITPNPNLASNIPANGFIIIEFPTYSTGFLENPITCSVQSSAVDNSYSCIAYNNVGWVIINGWIANLLPAAPNIIVKINNLQWPLNIDSQITKNVLLMTMQGAPNYNIVEMVEPISGSSYPNYFPYSIANSFIQASLSLPNSDDNKLGKINTQYEFEFEPTNDIPDNGYILLTFPSLYAVTLSNPQPIYSSSGLTAYDQILGIQYSASVNTITISNVKKFIATAGQTFKITVIGIKNPKSGTTISDWEIETQSQTKQTINKQSLFASLTFSTLFAPSTLQFVKIEVFPLNANVENANYNFTFQVKTQIPQYSKIILKFPSAQYPILPLYPFCKLEGALTKVKDCYLYGSEYHILTSNELGVINKDIKLCIFNIPNPLSSGQTDYFELSTEYDGQVLDITDKSQQSIRKVTISASGENIQVLDFYQYPNNEGEKSIYSFQFKTTNQVYQGQYFVIEFPQTYDQYVGETIDCSYTQGLSGLINICYALNNRVYISGFKAYDPRIDGDIILKIINVNNPNQFINTNTGYIKIMVLGELADASYLQYNGQAGVIELQAAPGWSYLNFVKQSNNYCRLKANYDVNITFFNYLPPNNEQGQILIEFSNEFQISNSKSLSCNSQNKNLLQGLESQNLHCYAVNNLVYINGTQQKFNGQLIFQIKNIVNPPDVGTFYNIQIKILDGFQRNLIEQSYPNLDPFQFSYNYPGPLITINNNNDIIVPIGTQTDDLFITVDYPCSLNLTIKGVVKDITIVPQNIDLKVSMPKTKFRIAASINLEPSKYIIFWETKNDLTPALYSPIKQTVVYIQEILVPIQISEVSKVVIGGSGLPIIFKVSNAPNQLLIIVIRLQSSYPGIYLSSNKIQFNNGENEKEFLISASSSAKEMLQQNQQIVLQLSLEGNDAASFSLSSNYISLDLEETNLEMPTITSLSILAENYIDLTFQVTTNCLGLVYYLIGLKGTQAPEKEEFRRLGPSQYQTTQSIYGKKIIGISKIENIKIENLEKEYNYTLFAFVDDRQGRSSIIYNISCGTLLRERALQFTLKINQNSLTESEMFLIRKEIAFVLSLSPLLIQNYIKLPTSDFYGKEDLTLKSDIGSIISSFYITSIVDNINFPSNLNLGNKINQQYNILKERIPNLDISYVSQFTEHKQYFAQFNATPFVDKKYILDKKITIRNISLTDYGYVYGIAVLKYPYKTEDSLIIIDINNKGNTILGLQSSDESNASNTSIYFADQINTSSQNLFGIDQSNLQNVQDLLNNLTSNSTINKNISTQNLTQNTSQSQKVKNNVDYIQLSLDLSKIAKEEGKEINQYPSSLQISKGIDYRNTNQNTSFVKIFISKQQQGKTYNISFENLTPDTEYFIFLTAGSDHPNFPDLIGDERVLGFEVKTLKTGEINPFSIADRLKITFVFMILIILFCYKK